MRAPDELHLVDGHCRSTNRPWTLAMMTAALPRRSANMPGTDARPVDFCEPYALNRHNSPEKCRRSTHFAGAADLRVAKRQPSCAGKLIPMRAWTLASKAWTVARRAHTISIAYESYPVDCREQANNKTSNTLRIARLTKVHSDSYRPLCQLSILFVRQV
jgi:hypothetical protein